MTEDKTTLVRHSMRFFADEKDQKEAARIALSGLLMMAARAVEDGEPEDLAEYSVITISLQKKRWDRTFVFELKAMEETTMEG